MFVKQIALFFVCVILCVRVEVFNKGPGAICIRRPLHSSRPLKSGDATVTLPPSAAAAQGPRRMSQCRCKHVTVVYVS